jgi:hypothetical protein
MLTNILCDIHAGRSFRHGINVSREAHAAALEAIGECLCALCEFSILVSDGFEK